MSLTPINTAQLGIKFLKTTPKLSPKFLSPLQNLNFPPRNCVKKLFFSPNKPQFDSKINETLFKTQLETHRNENVLINTPKKFNILNNGVDQMDNVIGKGTFGTVIKATYRDREVAAKVVKTEKVFRERNAINLSHENIVKIIEIISDNKQFSIILMEYCNESKELQSLLDNEDFELTESGILKFALDITKGLEYCHKNNVLHLDIKPKNILFCNGICKICDFGNSIKLNEIKGCEPFFQGTVAYAAPEILKGELISEKCDIYSLGILFWQLKYRIQPYDGLNNEIIIYKVVKFQFRPTDNVNFQENENEYSKLYRFCWQKEPHDRPSASLIRKTLESMNFFICF